MKDETFSNSLSFFLWKTMLFRKSKFIFCSIYLLKKKRNSLFQFSKTKVYFGLYKRNVNQGAILSQTSNFDLSFLLISYSNFALKSLKGISSHSGFIFWLIKIDEEQDQEPEGARIYERLENRGRNHAPVSSITPLSLSFRLLTTLSNSAFIHQ